MLTVKQQEHTNTCWDSSILVTASLEIVEEGSRKKEKKKKAKGRMKENHRTGGRGDKRT